MQFRDALTAEQARFLHRTAPTTFLGSLLVLALVITVFHDVVPTAALTLWSCVFVVVMVARMVHAARQWYSNPRPRKVAARVHTAEGLTCNVG